jgi:thioredoxin
MAVITEVTQENFIAEVIDSELPLLLDCWAAWCGPCRMLAPEIEALAEEQEERLRVAKLNVDENPEIAQLCGISLLPTMLLFVDGVIQTAVVGYHDKGGILVEIEPHLRTKAKS